ncbi:hypothetical protein JHK86_056001 [Glycine max]|nr:hypothetical protein JHK86_056001 [Glycine max]
MVRKMTIVGLWCIQSNPSIRPATGKVVEMLDSKVDCYNCSVASNGKDLPYKMEEAKSDQSTD